VVTINQNIIKVVTIFIGIIIDNKNEKIIKAHFYCGEKLT
jgi:hypothetical protein